MLKADVHPMPLVNRGAVRRSCSMEVASCTFVEYAVLIMYMGATSLLIVVISRYSS